MQNNSPVQIIEVCKPKIYNQIDIYMFIKMKRSERKTQIGDQISKSKMENKVQSGRYVH